jgi:hypothetical protein
VPIWHVNRRLKTIAPELAEQWWIAIDAAGVAIDAAEVDGDLSAAQSRAKRRALLAERRWLKGVSALHRPPRSVEPRGSRPRPHRCRRSWVSRYSNR